MKPAEKAITLAFTGASGALTVCACSSVYWLKITPCIY
ncbi:hypothetical protein JCM19240_6748 [Vibrio maritimus]|uniref:Lipoprotein n=1 Tax=Vibrio maritimus TaxID=990268 RepID=A0A090U4L1_9VIBR|nr:hypothetical protein JCM19240_6748 [Vibrio maritimus]